MDGKGWRDIEGERGLHGGGKKENSGSRQKKVTIDRVWKVWVGDWLVEVEWGETFSSRKED